MQITGQVMVRSIGQTAYKFAHEAMQRFVDERTDETVDEFWFLEHPRVFTLGQAAKTEHLLAPGDIDVVQSDRGGQVTYHGPGQIVVYLLLDLKRKQFGPRALVESIERAVVSLLAQHSIIGTGNRQAPGVYVDHKKIASLGLRIRRGCSFHGMSLNVDMDLEPFQRINPCGIEGLQVTQMADLGVSESSQVIADELLEQLCKAMKYDQIEHCNQLPDHLIQCASAAANVRTACEEA